MCLRRGAVGAWSDAEVDAGGGALGAGPGADEVGEVVDDEQAAAAGLGGVGSASAGEWVGVLAGVADLMALVACGLVERWRRWSGVAQGSVSGWG